MAETNLDAEGRTAALKERTGAVVLAAGQSRRMGKPKLLLPWRGGRTVIEQVVQTLLDAGIQTIVVVVGSQRDLVEKALRNYPIKAIFNDRFAETEMITSLQLGLQQFDQEVDATLIVLGDQPTIQVDAVRDVVDSYLSGVRDLVVPSYQMRRGHPWLVSRSFWPEILSMPAMSSMREFLNQHADKIFYVLVDSPVVIQDMDTPDDYRRLLEGE